jgi:hypothetical protein
MTGRILRLELRRTIGIAVAAITVVLMLGLFYFHGPWQQSPTAWTAQWSSLAGWQRELLTFLWPVALGAGALQGLRDSRSGMLELLGTTSLPTRRRSSPTALAIGLWLTLGYLVVLAVGGVQVAGNTSYFPLGWIPVALVGILALVAAGLLGMGLGRLAPSRLTPPLLAVVGLVAMIVLNSVSPLVRPDGSIAVALLAPGLANIFGPIHDVFTTVAGSVTLGQALWFAGLAVAGLVLLSANRALTRVAAAVPVVLGLVAALLVLPSNLPAAYAHDSGASALVCADGAPRVCVSRAHEYRLAALTGPARDALRVLSVLPGAPTSAVEDTRTDQGFAQQPLPPANEVVLDFNAEDFHHSQLNLSPDQLRLAVLASAMAPTCIDPNTDLTIDTALVRRRAAQAVAVSVLLGRSASLRNFQYVQPQIDSVQQGAWQTVHGLPADVQRARVIEVRTAALTCHGDLLTILTTGSA